MTKAARIALLVAALQVAAVAPASVRAGADPADRLGKARRELRELVARIEGAAASARAAQDDLARARARADAASSRLGEIQHARAAAAELATDVEADLAAAQAAFDEVVAETFMSAPGGSVDLPLFGAIAAGGTLQDMGDRFEFAAAASEQHAEAAARLTLERIRALAQQTAADALVAEQIDTLDRTQSAMDDATAAAERSERAMADLDGARVEAIDLIVRLRDRLDGIDPVAIDRLAEAFQGADSVSYGDWAEMLLKALGAPACRSNVVVVVAWQVAESTQAAWNPLATTHRMPGSTDFNWVGVQDFRSLAQGLQATKETIDNGWDVYGYGEIVFDLRACADPMDTARSINASSWCPGCVDGMYVLNVIPRVDEDLDAYRDL